MPTGNKVKKTKISKYGEKIKEKKKIIRRKESKKKKRRIEKRGKK